MIPSNVEEICNVTGFVIFFHDAEHYYRNWHELAYPPSNLNVVHFFSEL